jgi:hypothetical protein
MLIIFVWNEFQLVPAKLYGEAQHKPYQIRVSKEAAKERDAVLSSGGNAIVYHFNSSSSSAEPRQEY